MKILVLSDVVFYSIEKEITKRNEDYTLETQYHEDISVALMSIQDDVLKKYDLIFIHSDQLFHRKNFDWHLIYFENLFSIISRCPDKEFIVTNSWSNSFPPIELNSSFGSLNDQFNLISPYIKKLIGLSNCYIFDFLDIVFKEGIINLYNYRLGILYQMPYSKKMVNIIADRFDRYISFLKSEEKKVIVLDCDNTLWGGVLGEDGIENINCDMNADGILYYSFQNFLKERKNDGFLLCLCSKNNEEDVKNAFEKKNMPLKWQDFILKKVSWQDKSVSIKEIAAELKLGENSFIFVDDNPNEIEMVKKFTSTGNTFLFSDDFEQFIKLTEDFAFRRKKILQADREKSKQYELETLRSSEQLKFGSIDDYIESLEIKMDIRLNDFDDFDRLSQLTEKTNQFNFNKSPYTKNELIEWTNKGNDVYSLKVNDKFGDYGTVGLIMIKKMNEMITVENFLLSCRVLGKKIENKFFNSVIDCYKLKGINLKEILVKVTEKNVPARTFIKTENYDKLVKLVNPAN